MKLNIIKTDTSFIFYYGSSYIDYQARIEYNLSESSFINLATRHAYRRQGLARSLVIAALEYISINFNPSSVSLIAKPTLMNISLIDLTNFYLSLGFSIKETSDNSSLLYIKL